MNKKLKEDVKKNVYVHPQMKVIKVDSCDIICTSDITPQSDEPENIEYGGSF